MFIFDWLNSSKSVLEELSETSALDAQLILSQILKESRSYILAHSDRTLSNQQVRRAEKYLSGVKNGIPLPYLIKKWDFNGRFFNLSKKVLIPRPETELMVERAVRWIKSHHDALYIADVGTGTGCVAISIGLEFPSKKYYATDISRHAIKLAKVNSRQYKLDKAITFVQTNFLEKIDMKFDLICANLPYIPAPRLQFLKVKKFEPIEALDGGSDGFRIIDLFLSKAHQWLKPMGCILCEIDDTHSRIAINSAEKYWPQKNISIQKDLSGRTRLLVIE